MNPVVQAFFYGPPLLLLIGIALYREGKAAGGIFLVLAAAVFTVTAFMFAGVTAIYMGIGAFIFPRNVCVGGIL